MRLSAHVIPADPEAEEPPPGHQPHGSGSEGDNRPEQEEPVDLDDRPIHEEPVADEDDEDDDDAVPDEGPLLAARPDPEQPRADVHSP